MKEKLIEFFQAKKELFVFLGLLIVTFVTVIAIAEVSIFNEEDQVVVTPDVDDDTTNDDLNDDTTDDVVQPEVINKITSPTLNTVVVRDFYDYDNKGQNSNAIIETNSGYLQSKGISYAREDNTSFDVTTIYPGTVLSVVEDEILGTTITIDHGDDLISVYYSLASANVVEGEVVVSEQVIGVSGASTFDINAGVHVHVEVISEGNYINLETLIGKTMDEVVASIK